MISIPRRRRRCAALIPLVVLLAVGASADEGMWTFDNPPRRIWKDRYDFDPSGGWLDHLRLSSVRIVEGTGGGSAAFVSSDGLLVTNQHVADGQLQKLSTRERDLVWSGFYAPTRGEELKCPDLEADVLVSYEDVTARVHGAVKGGMTDAQAAAARRQAIAAIERESRARTNLRSDVVTLYDGGEYWLYRYKQYMDIRLVFAPEEQIAYFGGDYDNFTYPRHDLDVAFLRVYENGRPARTDHFLKWSARGPADGEFVVLAGYPGSTDRLLTVTQIGYQRDVGNPLQRRVWESRRDALAAFAAHSPEHARRAGSSIRSLENSLKRLAGQQQGLDNPRIMRAKQEEERALRAAVAGNPEWQRRYGDAWDRIDAAYRELPAMAPRIAFSILTPSRLADYAASLVRFAAGGADAARPTAVLSTAPVYPDLEEAILAAWLDEARRTLGADDPFVAAALQGRTAGEAAHDAIAGTTLADVEARRRLLDGGPEAIQRSTDPLIALARRVDGVMRDVRTWREDRVRSVELGAGQQIASARFEVYGKTVYPDATFTLRLGFGRVLGYEEDTTLVPWTTTFFGLFDRAAGFAQKAPFALPERWRGAQGVIDLATPLNFVYTVDTIGGHSGSPVVNRRGELVGLNFDSNRQKLPNRYLYVDEAEGARAVAVHSAAIVEALKKLYRADALVEEISRT